MSTPPIVYSGPAIDPEVPFNVRRHLQLLYQKLGNHTQAFALQQAKINSIQAGTKTTIVEGGGGGGSSPSTATGIAVNNRSGVISYATTSGDNNALIVFSDASGIAVSLTQQAPPWGAYIANIGALGLGTVTLTPATGTINGAATLAVLPTYGALVAFDGTNWWAMTMPIVPVNTASVAHQWINSYDSANGTFTQTQPAVGDVSGAAPLASPALTGTPTAPTASPLTDDTQIATTAYADAAVAVEKTRAEAAEALLAPIASPTFTGTVTQPTPSVLTGATTAMSATAGSASALPATPAIYLEISVNGTIYKFPGYLV